MTAGWWRRHAVSLSALAVLLPVTVGAIAINEWSQFDVGNPTRPTTVQPGDALEYAGARVGPAKAEFTDNPAAPSGTRVVRAVMLISPGNDPISCAVPVLREIGGAQRQWSEASSLLDLPYEPERHTICDSERLIRYSLTVDFLVPEDAVGPFTVDVIAGDAAPRFVKLVIEP